jgi:response regulator RpfG family c-di-GMP phosphodiesterase
MRGEAGRHFDPILVECLIEAMPVVRRVQHRFAETAALRA